MDNVVEKLGFFDFFNHIIAGMYTIVGTFFIFWQFGYAIPQTVFAFLVDTTEVNSLFLVLCIFSVIVFAYILGMVFHELFSIADEHSMKSLRKLTEDLFTDEKSCIENPKRRKRYKIIAKKIFDCNSVEYECADKKSEIKWTYELNNYFFTYCLYQIQIKGLNQKTEKLRGIEGLAKSFCLSSGGLLVLLGVLCVLRWDTFFSSTLFYVIECIILIIITVVFFLYRLKALKNRIRMTLSIYEAIYDRETKR